jgi:thioredoxin-related protein
MIRPRLHVAPGVSAPGAFARLVLAIMLLSGAAFSTAETTRDPYAHFFAATFGDLPEEMALAEQDGKLGMLLFFEADACTFCEHMRRKVLNQADVQDWFTERFVNIAIDIHGDVEVKDFDGITLPMKVFAEHRRVFMTPVTAFVDHNGAEVYRHLGMIKTPEEFLLLGKYIEGKHYFDREFKVFAEQQGMSEEDEVLVTPAGETQ